MSYANSPQFSNPWSSSQAASHTSQLFPSSMGTSNAGFDALKQQQNVRSTTSSMPYSSVPASAPSLPATNGYPSYTTSNLLDMSQDLLKPEFPRSTYEQGYSTAPASVNSYAPTSAPYVSSYSSLAQPQQPDEIRRLSHSSVLRINRHPLECSADSPPEARCPHHRSRSHRTPTLSMPPGVWSP